MMNNLDFRIKKSHKQNFQKLSEYVPMCDPHKSGKSFKLSEMYVEDQWHVVGHSIVITSQTNTEQYIQFIR